MAENKVDILFDLKIQENRVKRELSKLNEIVKTADRRTRKYKEAVKGVVNAEMQLANIRKKRITINKQAETSVKKLTKAQIKAKNATGATTSSVLELGRAISDAPYGIRGMANNLTQLISQLAFATKASGGLRLALKGMWKAMMGPLGVVLALTSVISALDFFFGATEKAVKSTDNLKDSMKEFAGVLSTNTNVNVKDYLNLLKQKKELDESLVKSSEELKTKEEELNNAINRRVELEEKIKNSKLNTETVQKEVNRLIEREKTLTNEISGIYEKAGKEINKYNEAKKGLSEEEIKEGSLKDLKQQLSIQKKQREEVATTAEEYDNLSVSIDNLQKKIDKIEGKTPKKEKIKLEPLIDTKIDAKDKFKAFADTFGFNLKKQLEKNRISAGDGIDLTITPEQQEQIDKYNKELSEKLTKEYKAEALQERLETIKQGMSVISDFIASESERELAIEQNKTNVLNSELNKRLINEKLSADERKNIQNQIAQNDEELRKKQNKIKKKQFNTQKAFNISTATIDTYLSASKAYASQLTIPSPDAPIRAKIAAAVATAAGLARVASIARQKFQPMAPSTPARVSDGGGSSSTTQSRQPTFNIVGRSSESQLAEVIQGQFNKPVKAYVVSKEVTTQQQLDLNIQSSASI